MLKNAVTALRLDPRSEPAPEPEPTPDPEPTPNPDPNPNPVPQPKPDPVPSPVPTPQPANPGAVTPQPGVATPDPHAGIISTAPAPHLSYTGAHSAVAIVAASIFLSAGAVLLGLYRRRNG
ncbi:hypothetical protein [Trueperella sp. LYQ143]|uniref:hypothetical protein n=1 Tax=Trueperella sp. LYQ143 TaxID=3391059 RepID=UPI003983BD02